MIKKIILGVLLVGLIAVLVIGAINRTMAKDRQSEEALEQGGKSSHVDAVEGQRETIVGEQLGEGSSEGGKGGKANTDASGFTTETDQTLAHEWLELQGEVESADEAALTVTLLEGEKEILDCRAWEFAREQGFSAQVGDQVTLKGFYENNDFKVGQVVNLTNDQSVLLRNSDGKPLWSGGGESSD